MSEAPIMKGTYESRHLKVILTVTHDEIYEFKYSRIEPNGAEITQSEFRTKDLSGNVVYGIAYCVPINIALNIIK